MKTLKKHALSYKRCSKEINPPTLRGMFVIPDFLIKRDFDFSDHTDLDYLLEILLIDNS